MTDQADQKRALVDIRRTTRSENVACQAKVCNARWAKYVVTCDVNPYTLETRPVRTYLCQKCLTGLLSYADELYAG